MTGLGNAQLFGGAQEESVGHPGNVVAHLAVQRLAGRFFPIAGRHPVRVLQQKLEQSSDLRNRIAPRAD